MGELLEKVGHQQALLDGWAELRRRAEDGSATEREIEAFEPQAAKRIARISTEVLAGTWRPSPVRPVRIPKSSGGHRKLGVPVLEDRIVERALLDVLDPIIDPHLLPWSFAYRRGLGVDDAVAELAAAREEGARFVVRCDLADCFDTLPRSRVLDALADWVEDPELLELVRLLVHRPAADDLRGAPRGLHQGSSLSPLLANVYLDGFDRAVLREGHQVIRYADDVAVPCSDRPTAEDALKAVQVAAQRLGLALSDSKSSVRSFDEGVPFLGSVVSEVSTARSRSRKRPDRATAFIVDEGGLFRSKGPRLRLERDGETVVALSVKRTRQIVIFGRTGFTTPFIERVLSEGIDVVLLSATGRYFGRLQPASGGSPHVRRAQFDFTASKAQRLPLARRIVDGKIVNQRAGVLRAARRLDTKELQEAVRSLERDRRQCADARSLPELMGVEGAASRRYFAVFRSLIGDEWGFTTRQRRPPPDPTNALLSLGYTLLLHDAIAALETVGLDPFTGVLHEPRVGKPSLAFDLVEEFRPLIVDSVVIRCLNTGRLKPEHFEIEEGPPKSCRCSKDGLRRFLAAYEKRMLSTFTHQPTRRKVSYRVAMILQARQLADAMADPDGITYQPILWK